MIEHNTPVEVLNDMLKLLNERAKCAAEHYTREEVRELLVKAILYVDPDVAEEREPPVSWACEAAEAIADRLLAEERKP